MKGKPDPSENNDRAPALGDRAPVGFAIVLLLSFATLAALGFGLIRLVIEAWK